MKSLTSRPEKIIGNIAVASLLAGAPTGLALSVYAGLTLPNENSLLEWAIGIRDGLLLGPFFVFLAGLVVLAPALSLLRHFGYGGPMAVYAITGLFSLYAMHDNLRFGLAVLAFSLPASYVFCRYSYSSSSHDEP